MVVLNSIAKANLFKILYEDSHIVAVNKCANVLSVQGKPNQVLKPRFEQWKDLLISLHGSKKLSEELKELTGKAISYDSIPRKKDKFITFLKNISKTLLSKNHSTKTPRSNDKLCEQIWNEMAVSDLEFTRQMASSKRLEDISIPEILEELFDHRIYHVHRLDLETSGIVLYAKSSEAAGNLMQQFRERSILKTYLAKVVGLVPFDLEKVELAIRPDFNNRPKQVIDSLEGKKCVTLIKKIEHIPKSSYRTLALSVRKCDVTLGNLAPICTLPLSATTELDMITTDSANDFDMSLLELMPVTGRTHQLRLHLSAINFPILGDTLYSPPEVRKLSSRMCLHASSITFKHPVTNAIMTIDAEGCDFNNK